MTKEKAPSVKAITIPLDVICEGMPHTDRLKEALEIPNALNVMQIEFTPRGVQLKLAELLSLLKDLPSIDALTPFIGKVQFVFKRGVVAIDVYAYDKPLAQGKQRGMRKVIHWGEFNETDVLRGGVLLSLYTLVNYQKDYIARLISSKPRSLTIALDYTGVAAKAWVGDYKLNQQGDAQPLNTNVYFTKSIEHIV